MRLMLLAAAALGAAITAPACALAATTVTQGLGTLNSPTITTFGDTLAPGAANYNSSDTFVYTFTLTGPWEALFAMQAQHFYESSTKADPIQFELDKVIGGNWTEIAKSDYVNGAVIPPTGNITLGAGHYELVTDMIGTPMNVHGSLDGSVTLTSVPEPATWAMLILGVGLIGFAARRRSEGMVAAA